jgi:hypothetical protein
MKYITRVSLLCLQCSIYCAAGHGSMKELYPKSPQIMYAVGSTAATDLATPPDTGGLILAIDPGVHLNVANHSISVTVSIYNSGASRIRLGRDDLAAGLEVFMTDRAGNMVAIKIRDEVGDTTGEGVSIDPHKAIKTVVIAHTVSPLRIKRGGTYTVSAHLDLTNFYGIYAYSQPVKVSVELDSP